MVLPDDQPDPILDGLWTLDVLIAWLESIGVPHDPQVRLHRGPSWKGVPDRAGLVTITPGASRPPGNEEARARWPGFQLAFRGRQRTRADRDAETLALGADRIIMRAGPQWVPAGGGWVRLASPVRWSGAGPSRISSVPDAGERQTWAATYLTHVIEEH